MEVIKITANTFQEAVDAAFSQYGIQTSDIIDFEDNEDGTFDFKVNKTIESEVKLNNQVKELVSSNQFQSEDIAFICSDDKVHTPDGGNLFDRIKSLLKEGITPLIGFTNFIDASEVKDELGTNLDTSPVAYNNLILSKEGNMLKGTKIKTIRKTNSRLSEPLFRIEVDSSNPTELSRLVKSAAEKLRLTDYLDSKASGTKLEMQFTMDCPMDLLNLLFICMHQMPGIKRFTVTNEDYLIRGDMK